MKILNDVSKSEPRPDNEPYVPQPGERPSDVAERIFADGPLLEEKYQDMSLEGFRREAWGGRETIFITKACHLHDYTVEVVFNDQTRQIIDFTAQIEKIRVPEYQKYQQVEHFKEFAIENGNLVWGEDWDLIFPVDQLYDNQIK